MATSAAEPRAGRRIGILGGSFNPPHNGHLAIAAQAWWQLDLDVVLFVPADAPPHKVIEDRVPAGERLALTQAAVAGDGRFAVDDIEIVRGTRYTIDTLLLVREEHPGDGLWFLIGSDSLLALDTWRAPERIAELARLAVAPRPGDDPRRVLHEAAARRAEVLDVPALAISSTDIRRRVRAGMPITGLVPAPVEERIHAVRLYRAEAHGDA